VETRRHRLAATRTPPSAKFGQLLAITPQLDWSTESMMPKMPDR
jgi:hypothetical protein